MAETDNIARMAQRVRSRGSRYRSLAVAALKRGMAVVIATPVAIAVPIPIVIAIAELADFPVFTEFLATPVVQPARDFEPSAIQPVQAGQAPFLRSLLEKGSVLAGNCVMPSPG